MCCTRLGQIRPKWLNGQGFHRAPEDSGAAVRGLAVLCQPQLLQVTPAAGRPRCFRLSCRAVGVHPPLELSHYQIKFAATALYSTSVATLYVVNSHLSRNLLTHSVPRIGSAEACPVGPTSFEFLLPTDSPITISPSVGTVLPGKVSGPSQASFITGVQQGDRLGRGLQPWGRGPDRPMPLPWPVDRPCLGQNLKEGVPLGGIWEPRWGAADSGSASAATGPARDAWSRWPSGLCCPTH